MKLVVTGQRPHKIGSKYENELACKALEAYLEDLKPEILYTGMALGTDLYALGWACHTKYQPKLVVACIPYPEWNAKWDPSEQFRVNVLIGHFSEKRLKIITISDTYYDGVELDRNRYMIDQKPDRVAAVLNERYKGSSGTKMTVNYAKQKQIPVDYIKW